MAIQTQSRTNPWSILCQSRSTHLQSSANLLAIWINPFPIRQSINSIQWQSGPTQFQSSVNLGQSSANPPPIRHQSVGHLGQSIANPRPIKYQSSVNSGHSTNQMPILDLSAKFWSVANPPIQCQIYIKLPIHRQSTNPITIRQSFTNQPIHHQPNSNPWSICQSDTNPRLNCQFITNLPIHYQSANPLPICQSITNITIHYQSYLGQSNVNSMPIHNQYIWPLYSYTGNKCIIWVPH